ncbi:hypothetical protein [Saccharibacillus sp. JS10]|uniref:hypothetical protein n=1 Tax=Saccharibacillus sp. JS10 TaxID=2950552 RepID=UPI002109499A|nr:hypothetical protein [Saccharibacillus sp. JS10]MCQ4085464.1 hypothetical protein [Saccharibacillus sp. JS10]
MVMYAFRDPARTIKVVANTAFRENKSTRFYCPNLACDAHMHICGRNGSAKFYFSTQIKRHRHVENCPYHASLSNFDPTKYDENKFDFNEAFLALTEKSNPQTKKNNSTISKKGSFDLKPPRTLLQIYGMCKTHHYTDTYNGHIVGKILVYEGSTEMYSSTQDIVGNRIVELKRDKPKFYDSSKNEIHLKAYLGKKEYKFSLKFDDITEFKAIRDEIFNNKDNNIIVAGKWSFSVNENKLVTIILSKKQIKILK